ncbi:MAG TPA: hypothetical protein VMW25_03035 [Clostridia bacterium]|nr:hypothetical protein [Clostridia bacterium]
MKKYILINDSGELVAEEKTMIELDEAIINQEEDKHSKLWIAQVTHEVIGVHIEKKRLFHNPASEKEKKK